MPSARAALSACSSSSSRADNGFAEAELAAAGTTAATDGALEAADCSMALVCVADFVSVLALLLFDLLRDD